MTMSIRQFVVAVVSVAAASITFTFLCATGMAEKEGPSVAPRDSEAFRVIPIEKRAYEYGGLRAMVINAKGDLARLPVVIEGAGVPGEADAVRARVAAIVDQAKPNFDSEVLVLLPHQEGSGSTMVKFHRPTLKDGTLICRISRQVPEVGDADVASYCFGLVVKRSAVRQVELYIGDRKTIELLIPGMPPVMPRTRGDRASMPD